MSINKLDTLRGYLNAMVIGVDRTPEAKQDEITSTVTSNTTYTTAAKTTALDITLVGGGGGGGQERGGGGGAGGFRTITSIPVSGSTGYTINIGGGGGNNGSGSASNFAPGTPISYSSAEAEEEVEVTDQETELLEDQAAEAETTSEDLETEVLEIVHLYHHLKEITVVTQKELHTMKPAVAVAEQTLQEDTRHLKVEVEMAETVVQLFLEICEPEAAEAVDTVHQMDQAAQAAEVQEVDMDLLHQPRQIQDLVAAVEVSQKCCKWSKWFL